MDLRVRGECGWVDLRVKGGCGWVGGFKGEGWVGKG